MINSYVIQKKHMTKFSVNSWYKTLSKQGLEYKFINMTKDIYEKPATSIIFQYSVLKHWIFYLYIWKEPNMSPLSTYFLCCTWWSSKGNKKNKHINWNRRILNMSLFAKGMFIMQTTLRILQKRNKNL